MKILMAAQTFAPQDEGGAEISARMVATELQTRHEIVMLSLGRSDNINAPVGFSLHEGLRVIRVPFYASYLPEIHQPAKSILHKSVWYLRVMIGAVRKRDISRILETERPDLIYSQNTARMQPALWNAARSMGIPVVQHVRDYAFLCAKGTMFKNNQNCEKRCAECRFLTYRIAPASKDVAAAIAVSDFVRHRFRTYRIFPNARWHTMHNTNTPLSRYDSATLRDRSRIDKDRLANEITIGYLGTLSREKGIEEVLLSFFRLKQDGGVRLVVGGQGSEEYMDELKNTALNYCVEFLGHVPAHQVYAQADVIISGSRWHEPQSRILVEAAVYGVPVIATDRGGSSEIVVDNQTGWIYDPDDPDALYEILQRITGMGRQVWQLKKDTLFPGLSRYKGTAEDSRIYERLESIFEETVAQYVQN